MLLACNHHVFLDPQLCLFIHIQVHSKGVPLNIPPLIPERSEHRSTMPVASVAPSSSSSSSSTPILTREEVLHFLTEQLHLDRPSDAELSTPDLALLQRVCRAFAAEVPLSTIRMLNTPLRDRALPTLEQIKQIGMNKLGGLCYETNTFLHWLLAGLGFHVEFLLGRIYGSTVDNHVWNIVHNLAGGKSYLVDGGSYPMMMERLICVNDFDGNCSPVYVQSIWEVRLRRKLVDGLPGFAEEFRWTGNTAETQPQWKRLPVDSEGWAEFAEFPLVRRSQEELAMALRRIRTSQDVTIAPIRMRIYCVTYPGGRLLQICNTSLFWEDEKRERRELRARTREELEDLILRNFKEYFPDEAVVRTAVESYLQFVKSPPAFVTL
ncbi:hypothetical protein BV898_03961 [Hypsibius exemplaris]|uniref:arylamine N-acetyltransferase n=1 Tax=Hypsibius exemplaris TaxID=2072580 RepID=A0A1W0X3P6_HYPEX|nr:hypothetical protein BV898_03961 [Hypsibius exemplaris]